MNKCDPVTNKFKEPLNKILEVLISIIAIALGAIAFLRIMTPVASSLLYPLDNILRFGLFVTTLFFIMTFLAKPLFRMLKVEQL